MQNLDTNVNFVSELKKVMKNEYRGTLLSLCISGSHLYGTNSPDSDVDYRGMFAYSTDYFLGLQRNRDSIERQIGDKMNDVALNEVKKELDLLLHGNCNIHEHFVAEPIYTTIEYLQLKSMIGDFLTKNGLYYSYKGTAEFNYKKFILNGRNTVKKYLYVIRALLAGIYVMRTGMIEPNVQTLNDNLYKNYETTKLIEYKKSTKEISFLPSYVEEQNLKDFINKLFKDLDSAYLECKLPENPTHIEIDKAEAWLKKVRRRFTEDG